MEISHRHIIQEVLFQHYFSCLQTLSAFGNHFMINQILDICLVLYMKDFLLTT